MIKPISVLSMAIFLTACGGASSENENAIKDQAPSQLGAALPDPTNTTSLEVEQSFGFATARTIDIDFDIAAVRQKDATVTICTEFEPAGENFDVNFDSCSVSGLLVDGVFNHSMELTNDRDSVVAVVLFQDASIAPMFKEFTIDDSQRIKLGGDMNSVIVWQ